MLFSVGRTGQGQQSTKVNKKENISFLLHHKSSISLTGGGFSLSYFSGN